MKAFTETNKKLLHELSQSLSSTQMIKYSPSDFIEDDEEDVDIDYEDYLAGLGGMI